MTWTFVDLFAGIGGFHRACAANGGRCVAACEIDDYARECYVENYGVRPHPDIRTMAPIRGVDLVCAGFPCQSHSTLGRRRGMRDARGRLFYDLCRWIRESAPAAFLLENVKGLLRSMPRVIEELSELGYTVTWAVLDSRNFSLPQHRERVYIVGMRDVSFDFSRLLAMERRVALRDILDSRVDSELDCHIFDGVGLLDPPHKTKSGFVLRAQLSNYTNRKLFSSDGIVGTITTGSPPPIYDEGTRRIRHLSIGELKRCQGFPQSQKFPSNPSRSTVLHYIGNAVSVNVIRAIVKEIRRPPRHR
jgi:DNA (cytosine-5)-methyltransferase 1